ncbi:MAG: hypothetical protein QGG71_26720, partial [Pirellulaceae bacterium]|nr:hypothetical protein [Pirellulaceae bacterium]
PRTLPPLDYTRIPRPSASIFERRSQQLEEAAKMLEKLRNNLAHSQDIITNDWETIVTLSERLDEVLEGPPGLNGGQAYN